MFWISTLNFWLAVAGVGGLVLTIALAIDYLYNNSAYYKKFVQPHVWPLIILTTVGGVAISLLYSEYFGFIPCSLCWLQRIALYPQALFAVMAFRTKESVFFPLYGTALSVCGLLVALYHYVYQMIPKGTGEGGLIMPCLADGTADCGAKIIDEFGFMTFPLLSAITFAFLIVLYLNLRRQAHR